MIKDYALVIRDHLIELIFWQFLSLHLQHLSPQPLDCLRQGKAHSGVPLAVFTEAADEQPQKASQKTPWKVLGKSDATLGPTWYGCCHLEVISLSFFNCLWERWR